MSVGHDPPLPQHQGTWRWLRQRGGNFLGMHDAAQYRSCSITLAKGDELLLYTDGVTEAFSADDRNHGEARPERLVVLHADDCPDATVEAVREAERSDDVTMLMLGHGTPPVATGSVVLPAKIENLDVAMELVNGELERHRCPMGVQNQVDIALEELFVNVCHYAYARSDELGTVRVDYAYGADPSSITVRLSDQGIPFDPLTRADPTKPTSVQEAKIGGLGIFMAKQSVDEISYQRDGDTNIVVFKKVW